MNRMPIVPSWHATTATISASGLAVPEGPEGASHRAMRILT